MSFDVDPRDRMIAALKAQREEYRTQSVLDAIALGEKDAEIERLRATVNQQAAAITLQEKIMNGSILQEGHTAARTGSDFMACPHPLGTDAAIQWMLGHWVWQLENDTNMVSTILDPVGRSP